MLSRTLFCAHQLKFNLSCLVRVLGFGIFNCCCGIWEFIRFGYAVII